MRFLIIGLFCACLTVSVPAQGQAPIDAPTPAMLEDEFQVDHTPPPEAMDHVDRLLRRLDKKDPEEAQRLRQLREEDPGAFHDALRSRLKNKRMNKRHMHGTDRARGPGADRDPEMAALRKTIKELVQRYNATDDSATKAELKTQLRAQLEEAFERKESIRKKHMERIAADLKNVQESLRKREENREAIIDRRLRELTEGDPLKW